MRVLRVLVGILTLLLAIPVLIGGAAAWWTMQQRSADGAFHAELTPIESSGILVVPDIDSLLRRDAPFARAEKTMLRLTSDGFIGMANPTDAATYLAGTGYTELQSFSLVRGTLPVRTKRIVGTGGALETPQDQDFWVRRAERTLTWNPADDRGQQVALIVVAPEGTTTVRLDAALEPGWLNSTAWGLLILGPVLLLLALVVIAWPHRTREIVYVMDPALAGHTQLAPPALPPTLPPVNVTYQPMPRPASPAQLDWPPAPAESTEPPREIEDADDRPMPIVGVHLHLTQKKS